MAHIRIRREHTLDHDGARKAAENMAAKLDQAHGMKYHWQGNALHFERSGINGHIRVEPKEVCVEVSLGLLFLPMKSVFENEIRRQLDAITGTA